MSPRRNWDSLTPSLASECAPPPGRLRARGGGSPYSDDWRKILALCLLCAWNARTCQVAPQSELHASPTDLWAAN
jgi:hypothetical protein